MVYFEKYRELVIGSNNLSLTDVTNVICMFIISCYCYSVDNVMS